MTAERSRAAVYVHGSAFGRMLRCTGRIYYRRLGSMIGSLCGHMRSSDMYKPVSTSVTANVLFLEHILPSLPSPRRRPAEPRATVSVSGARARATKTTTPSDLAVGRDCRGSGRHLLTYRTAWHASRTQMYQFIGPPQQLPLRGVGRSQRTVGQLTAVGTSGGYKVGKGLSSVKNN